MYTLEYILKIFYYFSFVVILYKVAIYFKNKKTEENELNKNGRKNSRMIPLLCIIIFCCFLGYYAIICGSYPYKSDRLNYAFRFADSFYLPAVKAESFGLYLFEIFLHIFTYEPKMLFFAVSFLFLFLTLIAYNSSDSATPDVLLLLGLSQYFIYSFYLIKQSIAVAFITLSFVMFEKNKKTIAILSIILAICFHESAWIVIPVYLAIYFSKHKTIRVIVYLILIICTIFFKQINQFIVEIATKIVPSLSYQIAGYLNDEGGIVEGNNIVTIFKGLPFYFITVFGFMKRKVLKEKLKNYDKYLFLSVFVSATIILSSYMYWMYRFGIFFYFPAFVLAVNILKEIKDNNEKILFWLGTYVVSFVLVLRLLIQFYFNYGGI